MALVFAEVKIKGLRPLLWHRFGPDALPLEKKAKTGVAGNDPQEWRRTVLVTAQRQLYLEPSYIFGCIRDGAKYTPRRRGTLQPVVASTLRVVQDRVLVDRWLPKEGLDALLQAETQPVYLDVRSVRNPATRGRNIRYRVAASPGWNAAFTLVWDNTVVAIAEMQAVIRDAGQFAGLGDARAIGFGHFEVSSFRVVEDRGAKKQTPKRSVAKASS